MTADPNLKPEPAPPSIEELVAYLDGELDTESSRHIEQQLAQHAEVREQLNTLERAWQLLDRLPRAEVTENFTQTTVEMVAIRAASELSLGRKLRSRRYLGYSAATAAALLQCGLLGFGLSRVIWPDPNQQLQQDQLMLQHLDEYRQIEDIEFLRELHRSGLFTEKSPGNGP